MAGFDDPATLLIASEFLEFSVNYFFTPKVDACVDALWIRDCCEERPVVLEAAVAKVVVLRGFRLAPSPPPMPPAPVFWRLKPKAPLGSLVEAAAPEVFTLLV